MGNTDLDIPRFVLFTSMIQDEFSDTVWGNISSVGSLQIQWRI